jgi:hypothetical protein
MLGRGKEVGAVAELVGVHARTVTRWRSLPDFKAEEERARQESSKPTAKGTLLDALSATRTDGIDWQARLGAAKQLLDRGMLADPADRETGGIPDGAVVIYPGALDAEDVAA